MIYYCNIRLPYRIRKVVGNISINILGHEGKKLWDGDGPVETSVCVIVLSLCSWTNIAGIKAFTGPTLIITKYLITRKKIEINKKIKLQPLSQLRWKNIKSYKMMKENFILMNSKGWRPPFIA